MNPSASPLPARPSRSGTATLWTVVAEALDPAYLDAHAASVRTQESSHTTAGASSQPEVASVEWQRPTIVIIAVAVGLVVGLAVNYLHGRGESTRSALKSKVIEQRQLLAERERDVAELDRRVAGLAEDALGTSASPQSEEAQRLAAAEAVSGPGLVVILSDPAEVAGKTTTNRAQRVVDADIQLVVNELWAGGAEAIVINGQRLGPTTAIREAGDAILVNYSPVQSPYRVAAIGPARSMRQQVLGSPAAKLLDRLSRTVGMTWKTVPVERIEAPAANVLIGKSRAVVVDLPAQP